MFKSKKKQRQKLLQTPLSDTQLALLRRNVPYFPRLPAQDQAELPQLVQVFLHEKNFEGCGDLEVTDEIRLTIAGLACLLLLRRETDFYPLLQSVIVYPQSFVASRIEYDESGLVTETEEELLGESWSQGSLVLSWEDIRDDIDNCGEGYNVVLHEFAHQLDDETGVSDGTPILLEPEMNQEWVEVCQREFTALQRDVQEGRSTLLDEYGADSEAEFFAVATEAFFEWSAHLKDYHPQLYALLARYFRQDPATWV